MLSVHGTPYTVFRPAFQPSGTLYWVLCTAYPPLPALTQPDSRNPPPAGSWMGWARRRRGVSGLSLRHRLPVHPPQDVVVHLAAPQGPLAGLAEEHLLAQSPQRRGLGRRPSLAGGAADARLRQEREVERVLPGGDGDHEN